jgi:cytochrome c oxidase subunit II
MPTLGRWRARTVVRAGLLVLAALALAGCLPQPRTDAGQDVANLYTLVLALAIVVFVGVEGFIVYAIVRYRRRPGDDVLPEQHHGNTLVEIIWTAIPTVIVLLLFVMSVITLGSVEARSENPGETILVEGFQWQWQFTYDDGTSIVGQGTEGVELPVPVGEPVRLVLESRDVNHAFYVPEFLIKRDLIKMGEQGDPNELEFTVTEPGSYSGQCAEFCGVGHADMVFTVNAMPREEFDTYMAAIAAGETPAPSAGACEVTVAIRANNTQFDIDEFEVPADTAFCIEFENQEDVPHNVSIYDGGDELFKGEILNTAGSITYSVPPLPAGEYDFICDVHPQAMVGTVTVTP